ncbi:MAG: uroporphyrinogen-III C-methyltransferase [Hyphomicrobium sp.]|nr:uroporphyrinogen-III C-methyltransferase [Hyphomicrobium sp.]
MSGFVSFVSAGPGDPELLTLKGAARLQAADVVLYDDLASGPILEHARRGANLVCVGKRAGLPSARQDHVSRLLTEYAATGARIVRLKSGDAGLFGRLEEEIIALNEAGIAYEIVPGVSSANAAAAAAGIPLTRRHASRRLQFVTGSDVSGGLPSHLNWGALADAQATTAVFMGKRTFPQLAERLVDHGLPETTPAILAESLGRSSQSIVRAPLAELAERLAKDTVRAPAIIIYGPLAEK